MDYGRGSGDVSAIKNDGTVVTHGNVVGSATAGCLLANSTTYYFPIGTIQTPLSSVHLRWAAAVAAVFTVETSNFPATVGGTGIGPVDVADWENTIAGNWVQENPSTAVVATNGSGNSATAATITAGGSAAGGATIHLGNLGTRRCRIKAVVTTGGIVRCNAHGKAGG